MSQLLVDRRPDGVEVITGPGRNGYQSGNLVFRLPGGPGAGRVLKVYRRRKGLMSDLLAAFSARVIEGKTGVTAATRCATEARLCRLWREQGFDVPELLEGERPDWVGDHPINVFEFIPGEVLHDIVAEDRRPVAERDRLLRTLGEQTRARHQRAMELGEPALLQEHATIKHVLVSGDAPSERLVTFDLEAAYRPGMDVFAAVVQELSSLLRSAWFGGDLADSAAAALVDGYGDDELMARACREYFSDKLRWRIKRRADRRYRARRSKTAAMALLAERLGVR